MGQCLDCGRYVRADGCPHCHSWRVISDRAAASWWRGWIERFLIWLQGVGSSPPFEVDDESL